MRVLAFGLSLWLLLSGVSEACQLYRDVMRDSSGNVIAGVTVTVTLAGTSTAATLYSDERCSTPMSNPLLSSTNGEFSFYAKDGEYGFTFIKSPGYTFTNISRLAIYDPLGENIVTVAKYATTDICATGTGAIDQIGATQITLVVNKPVTCSLDKTIPSTLTLQRMGGGIITVASGKTLTINSPSKVITDGATQIFECAGGSRCIAFLVGGTIIPRWFGTGTTSIQYAVSSAPAGSVVDFGGLPYSSGNVEINGKSNLILNGNGATINWSGIAPSGTNIGFQLTGMIANLTIVNFRLNGDGVIANGHAGVWNASGQTISNVKVLNNFISNVVVGISYNAALGGSFIGGEISGNFLDTIVGTAPGSGYGIHLANATRIQVHDNHINLAQRHSIYQALGVNVGNDINNNTITNHRQGVATDGYVAALVISRTTGAIIHHNTIIDSYDTAMEVSWDTQDAGSLQVDANKFINRKNTRPFIVIGAQGVPGSFNVRQLSITNNLFSNEYVTAGADIELLNGRQITYSGNTHRTTGIRGITRFISVGNASYITADTDADLTAWTDNVFYAEGPLLTDVRAFEIDGDICRNSSTHEFFRNRFQDVTLKFSLMNTLANINVKTDIEDTFAISGATPTVAIGKNYSVTQSGPTDVTNFLGGYEGKLISLMFTDANSTVKNTNIYTAGAKDDPVPNRGFRVYQYRSAAWREVSRSNN